MQPIRLGLAFLKMISPLAESPTTRGAGGLDFPADRREKTKERQLLNRCGCYHIGCFVPGLITPNYRTHFYKTSESINPIS